MRHERWLATAGAVAIAVVAGAAWITTGKAQTRTTATPGAAPTTAAPTGAKPAATTGRTPTGAPTAAPGAFRPGVASMVARPPRGGVDWQAAVGGLRQSANVGESLATNLDRNQVDMTALPILLPQDPKLTAGARIYSFGDYYTITTNTTGGRVSLSGTTTTVPLPAGKPLKIQTGPEGLTVQRTVDGQLASFVRFGVLYTVEIRCDAPSDTRCLDDNYVLGLVGKTNAVVMGKAARQAAGLGG